MKPSFEPLLEETLGQLFESETKEDPRQLKLFPDPEDPKAKPDTMGRALLKELERTGGMTRQEMSLFLFDRRTKKGHGASGKGEDYSRDSKTAKGWWNTNISAMGNAKIIIKSGNKWIVNPKIDIAKLKITVPRWEPSWSGHHPSSKVQANKKAVDKKMDANIKGALKQTSESVSDNMPEENVNELKKMIGKALESLKKTTPVMKNFADFAERRGFSTGEVVAEIRKYGSDPIAKKLLEKAIIAINEEK